MKGGIGVTGGCTLPEAFEREEVLIVEDEPVLLEALRRWEEAA